LSKKSATEVILSAWNRLRPIPGGVWLFNQLLRIFNPYSGSIRAYVNELQPGYVQTELRDQRRIRNHLNSIHALALANLGELTSGLALLSCLPANVRGIPIKISTDYFKKARGKLLAECHTSISEDLSTLKETMDYEVSAEIVDEDGDVVSRTVVNWRLGPIE
jgi:acyl-coenzyme A thioesterase PaaI-like protein